MTTIANEQHLKATIATMNAVYNRFGPAGMDISGHFTRIALGYFIVDGIDIESIFRRLRDVFVDDVNDLMDERQMSGQGFLRRSDGTAITRVVGEMNACLSVIDAAKVTL